MGNHETGEAQLVRRQHRQGIGGVSNVGRFIDHLNPSGKGVKKPTPGCTCGWGLTKADGVWRCARPQCGTLATMPGAEVPTAAD